MKSKIRTLALTVFTLAIALFLLMALAIVFAQLLGILLGRGQWVVLAYDVLARPSIIAAITVGICGFAYFNLIEGEREAEDS